MNIDSISAWCIFAGYIPFLAIIVILLHYSLRRFLWRLRKRQGKNEQDATAAEHYDFAVYDTVPAASKLK